MYERALGEDNMLGFHKFCEHEKSIFSYTRHTISQQNYTFQRYILILKMKYKNNRNWKAQQGKMRQHQKILTTWKN